MAPVALLAFVVMIGKGSGLFKNLTLDHAEEFMYPLFVLVVLLQLYLIRTKEPEHQPLFETFQTGDDFDDYLRRRLKTANEMRVIHISSGTSRDRAYPEIIDSFLKRGKSFSRVFSDSANPDVITWIWEDLRKYKDIKYNYFIYCLKDIRVEKETRTIGVMLIDDSEVCLGGGYHMKFTQPTICFRDPALVRFFADYFDQLKGQAEGIRVPGRSVNWAKLKDLFPAAKNFEIPAESAPGVLKEPQTSV